MRPLPQREDPLTLPSHRWVGVGRGDDPVPRVAARDAALAAVENTDAALLIVFWDAAIDGTEVLAGVRDVVPSAPLIGGASNGLVAPDDGSAHGVTITALGGDGFSVATASTGIGSDVADAGEAVASCLDEVEEKGSTVLLMIADGAIQAADELVFGAYRVAGADVPIVGGGLGMAGVLDGTAQLHDDHIMTGAVVAAAISSDGPLGVGRGHGCHRANGPLEVTRSHGAVVEMLDGRPALDVYLEVTDAPEAARHDGEAFSRWALTRPLGLPQLAGEEVRHVAAADFEARTIHIAAAVPPGGQAWVMDSDRHAVLGATSSALAGALEPFPDGPPAAVVAFDCVARHAVLGPEGVRQEGALLDAAVGGPVCGVYSYGEFGRLSGIHGYLNHSLVVLALG
ncbi:FIST signal transduction protein [Euzebya rosea]|uniref:FIST signal transduction protein n=1 Tax=Euzebya rosea TaxID=2052804 RepID=UPI0014754112|nr:FIST N-terminal domain-containing protein [Euzebya rosea]